MDRDHLIRSPVGRALIRDALQDRLTPAEVSNLSEATVYRAAVWFALNTSSEGIEAALATHLQGCSMSEQSEQAIDMAGLLVASGGTAWWSSPWNAREQIWLSAPSEQPDPARPPNPAPGKPPALLWTSSTVQEMPSGWWPVVTRGILGAIDELLAWKVTFVPGLRVFEIRTADDWRWLCERFPGERRALPGPAAEPGFGSRLCWPSRKARVVADRRSVLVEPDWSGVRSEFDGLHLTAAGLVTAQGVPIPCGEDVSMLWGWDAESTAWFRWPVERMHLIGTFAAKDPP
jgi:hypothetical protein